MLDWDISTVIGIVMNARHAYILDLLVDVINQINK